MTKPDPNWEARARRFQLVHDGSPDGMMMFGAVRDGGAIVDFEWLYCNASASRIVGRSPEDLLGKRLLVEMPGNREAGLFDIYVGVVELGAPHTHEFSYRHEGLDHWFRSTSIKLDDGFYVAFLDLTARKRAEEQVAQLAAVLRSSEHAVYSVSNASLIETWSRGAERLYGHTSAEMVGRSMFCLVPEELRGERAERFQQLLTRGGVESFHTTRLTKAGATVHVAVMVSPMTDPEGRPIGIAVIDRDISDELQLRERLAAADRMAWVGTFAAGAAHEINNPLTSVVGNLEVALEDLRDLAGGSPSGRLEELESMIVAARSNADRIRTIVRGLMTFSRADQERHSAIEIQPIVELAINVASIETRNRARVVTDYGHTPMVLADGARLGQVFTILIANAAQAIGDGDVEGNEIRILTSTDKATGNAVVVVQDTGPGISESIINRIFDPFFTTKPIGVGTGLGLSICRNIVAGLGGEVSARNHDRGALFRVVLPAATPVSTMTSSDSRRGAILVVDDEVAVGTILVRMLRDHDVTTVTRASQALALLDQGKLFDVIVSDLMMPEMSGIEFFGELLKRYPEAARRTVFISGGTVTPNSEAFLAGVANECLEKPFEPVRMRALVRRLPGVTCRRDTGTPKGRTRRPVPMTMVLERMEMIREGLVVRNLDGTGKTDTQAVRAIERIFRRAGLPVRLWHTLRPYVRDARSAVRREPVAAPGVARPQADRRDHAVRPRGGSPCPCVAAGRTRSGGSRNRSR